MPAPQHIDFSAAAMSLQSGPSPCVYDLDRETRRSSDAQSSGLSVLSLAGAAEQPDDFVTDVDDATEANLRSVSR
jgi:hypothetical protein